MRRLALVLSAWIAGGAFLSAAPEALAHSRGGPPGPDSGLQVPALTHGQMAGLAPFRAEILALADRHQPVDENLQRLTNHARIQFAWCLWGLMPGTVTDETSPFNSCAHAYLASTRAALKRLQEIAGDRPDTVALVRRVEVAMLENTASLEMCGYSEDRYNTAAIIRPDWPLLPGHRPSLSALALMAFGLVAGVTVFLRRTRAPL